ncbi:MAG: tRNA 4-thiouridine(8) synthase ThiI [Deltaproteobacteria bacterium]|nr:MAG: tRNA 4-thiouridine(8) synthase ThiI [Deltaproteobacteria bacterium]
MNHSPETVRALGLSSGGLDSILAALVLRNQGIHVEWISFDTPFFSSESAVIAGNTWNIPTHTVDITDAYIPMLKAPSQGYGKNMNPCLDCHTLMFNHAGTWLCENNFDFLFSGEVAGQRPKSQTKSALRFVEKHSGFDGKILRPLSAKRLPETPMEVSGLVDRSRLFDFQGRTRKPQLQLAKELGVTEFPSPAGGCILTEAVYSNRLRDLFAHVATPQRNDYHLLKFGRHFRLDATTKLVVGRTKADNAALRERLTPDRDIVLRMHQLPGPIGILPQATTPDNLKLAAAICAAYTKAPTGAPAAVMANGPEGQQLIQTTGGDAGSFQTWQI